MISISKLDTLTSLSPLPMTLDEIILIDDDKIITSIHSKMITNILPHTSIKSFENGEEGLRYMLNSIDNNLRTLVLVDLNMPVMSGFEFLNVYENALAYQDHSFTICLLTSSEDEKDIQKSKKYPSVLDYATKPLTPKKIKSILEQAMAKFLI